MQFKRYHFPGFTAKNAGDPVVSMNNPPPPKKKQQQQKKTQRLQRPQYRTTMGMLMSLE